MTIENAYQYALSIEEARRIEDKHLRHLILADTFWKASAFAEKSHKRELAADLDSYGFMSLNQIGKVVRLAPGTLARHLPKKPRKGGRFQPESLRALTVLRRQRLSGAPLSASTKETAIEAGTSASAAARLIDVCDYHLYS
ncbi:MAG: hypothetical protein NVS3B6_19490 [Pseudarthrobacter sp.]